MKELKCIFGFILIVTIVACNKSDEDVQDFGYNYYPVEAGRYIDYRVDEYFYDDFNNTIDTTVYLLRELIDSPFTDLEGRNVYKLKRYTASIDDSIIAWSETGQSWTIHKNDERLERTEENMTFVELSFPLRRSKSWDGNARNDSTVQDYTVLDYDLRIQYNANVVFAKTARINERNNVNLIEDQLIETTYARDIGPVNRIHKDLVLEPDSGEVVSGIIKTWTYLEHGTL